MIRAVTIDFWNTIVGTGNGEARRRHRNAALREALANAGIPWDEERVRAGFAHVYKEFELHWFGEQRTMTASESLAVLWTFLDARIDRDTHERVALAFEDSILFGPPDLLPGASEALRTLASRYKLAVISDTAFSPGRALRAVLAAHGVEKHFSAFVFSNETGVAKPHPRAFSSALAPLDVSPSEAVHIGDIERTDIAGAKDAGMKALLFHGDVSAMYFDAAAPTRADAVAQAWDSVPGIIATLDDVIEGSVTV